MVAPSYIVAIVTVLIGVQSFFGLNFLPEQWTAFIMVAGGLVVAVRQIWTGKSTWLGSRPQ